MTAITYAIGDVHGEVERLCRLHELIRNRHVSEFGDANMTVIHLGDYVDRGPDSAGVIDAVISQNTGHLARSALRVLRAKCDRTPVIESQEKIRIEIVIRENLQCCVCGVP